MQGTFDADLEAQCLALRQMVVGLLGTNRGGTLMFQKDNDGEK